MKTNLTSVTTPRRSEIPWLVDFATANWKFFFATSLPLSIKNGILYTWYWIRLSKTEHGSETKQNYLCEKKYVKQIEMGKIGNHLKIVNFPLFWI